MVYSKREDNINLQNNKSKQQTFWSVKIKLPMIIVKPYMADTYEMLVRLQVLYLIQVDNVREIKDFTKILNYFRKQLTTKAVTQR